MVWTQIPVAAIMAVLDCGLWEGTGLSVYEALVSFIPAAPTAKVR